MLTRSNEEEWSTTCVSSSSLYGLYDFQLSAVVASLPIHRCICCSCVNRYHDHGLVRRSRCSAVSRFNTNASHRPGYTRDRRRIVMNRSRRSIHRGPWAVIVRLTEVTPYTYKHWGLNNRPQNWHTGLSIGVGCWTKSPVIHWQWTSLQSHCPDELQTPFWYIGCLHGHKPS